MTIWNRNFKNSVLCLVHLRAKLTCVAFLIFIQYLLSQSKLNHLMLGEKPIKLIHQSIGVLISKSLSVLQSKVELQNVSFLLPSNMVRHLGMNSKSYASACLGTIMVVYEKSPYTWNKNQSVVSSCKANSVVWLKNSHTKKSNKIDLKNMLNFKWFNDSKFWQHCRLPSSV